MSGGIWGDKPMTALDAFTVSLSLRSTYITSFSHNNNG